MNVCWLWNWSLVWLQIVCEMYPEQKFFLLPPHVCGRLWRWCRLSVQTCLLQLIYHLDLNFPSSYLCQPYFVDCWILRIIFIGSEFIYPEPCPWVWFKIVSGMYPNRTYILDSTPGLWKFMARVPVFVISPVVINTLIGFKAVPHVIKVCSCVGKHWPKGQQGSLGYFLVSVLCYILSFLFYFHVCEGCFVFIFSPRGEKSYWFNTL